ncbi:MAG: hypothetical protein AB7U82_15775 [Blastocatellales bacterium]
MTKEEALRFVEGWAAANEIVIEETRRKTPEERFKDLGMLYRFGEMVGWRQLPQDDEKIVWERWRKLREKLGVNTSYVTIKGSSS